MAANYADERKRLAGRLKQYHDWNFTPGVYDHSIFGMAANLLEVDVLPLRCHMGDTVWIVGTKCLSGLYEEECDTYIHYGGCECHLDKEYTVFQRKVDGVMFLYLHDLDKNELFRWGETVFKTQEEAEAALAKMKEADHGK